MKAPQLPAPLGRPRMRFSLGAILVREGHITVERLEEALAGERASGRRLGEILVELDWVALYEVMPVRGELRKVLAEPTEVIRAAALAEGMTTLAQAGASLCREGVSSLEEIRRILGEDPDGL